jgi:hypothetical protein
MMQPGKWSHAIVQTQNLLFVRFDFPAQLVKMFALLPVAVKLPLAVIERAHLPRLQPPADAMEMEGLVRGNPDGHDQHFFFKICIPCQS